MTLPSATVTEIAGDLVKGIEGWFGLQVTQTGRIHIEVPHYLAREAVATVDQIVARLDGTPVVELRPRHGAGYMGVEYVGAGTYEAVPVVVAVLLTTQQVRELWPEEAA